MANTKNDMQSPGNSGKPTIEQPARHTNGPRPLGAVLPPVMRPVFRKRAPATAQLIADWDLIVGPSLASETVPRRLAAGSLLIGCTGPVALELQHLSESLMGRINRHMGHRVVERLRFVQDLAARPLVLRPARPTSEAVRKAAEVAVAGIPPGPLQNALLELGHAVLTRQRR